MKRTKLMIGLIVLLNGCGGRVAELPIIENIVNNECQQEKSIACCSMKAVLCKNDENFIDLILNTCRNNLKECKDGIK